MKFLAGIVGFLVYPPASLIQSLIASALIMFGISIKFPYKLAKEVTDSLLSRALAFMLVSSILTLLSVIIVLPLLPIVTVFDFIRSFFVGPKHGFLEGFLKLWNVIIHNPYEISFLNWIYRDVSERGVVNHNPEHQNNTQAILEQLGDTVEMNTNFDFSSIKANASEKKALSDIEINQIKNHLLMTTNDKLKSSFNQYNELLNKLHQEESEIIPGMDIEQTRIILFREYYIDNTWKIDTSSIHIGELESSQEWFKQRATHPLNRDDLREPEQVTKNGVEYSTRYHWQEYDPKNGKGFQLLNEYADSIRAQIKELSTCPSLLPETTANDDEDGHEFISPAFR